MSNSVSITLYGAAPGEIGGNRILLEWPEPRWLLDFGTRFGQTGKFFEEFVKPRGATLGLRDYLRMDLLPPLDGLYRSDTCPYGACRAVWAAMGGQVDDRTRGYVLSVT